MYCLCLLQEHEPWLILSIQSPSSGQSYQMSKEDYTAEKERLAKEGRVPVKDIGLFEPFPKDVRPVGLEEDCIEMLKRGDF